jgi:hypothetical protein
MLPIIDALKARRLRRAEASAGSYRQLVLALATNGREQPGADDVERVLAAAGKAPEELAADVEAKQRRAQQRALVERARLANGERAKLTAAVEKAEAALARATAAHQEVVWPAEQRLRELDALEREAAAARAGLVAGADDPVLIGEGVQLRDRRAAAAAQLDEARRQREQAERTVLTYQNRAANEQHPTAAEEARRQAQEGEPVLARHAAAIAAAEAELAQLQRDELELQARMAESP